MSKVVFITGCSTGIGRDLAQRLAQSGYTVAATARKIESLDGLQAALKLPLDVTQPDSVTQAVERTLQQFGRIDVLVNNAGYAVRGAVEEISEEQAQKIYSANVLGVMRMVRAVAPHMRAQASGRIINLSSIAGKLVTPGNGVYASTKFAVEALSDALRWELAPFGIQVVLVEPGPIKTHFMDTVEKLSEDVFDNPASPYKALYEQYQKVDTQMTSDSPGPEVVSEVIQRAIEAPKPKARYLAGTGFQVKLVIALGASVWEAVVKSMFKTGQ